MSLVAALEKVSDTAQLNTLIETIPYARLIGMQGQLMGDDVHFILPPAKTNIGNPMLPAIHGGVIGGFMDTAAVIHLMLLMDKPKIPAIIDFSLDYVRTGQLRETYAECQVHRQGRRVANVSINAWQTQRDKPIATARAHFLL